VLAEEDVQAPGHTDLDVTDRDRVRQAVESFRPDVVIHAAAWTDTTGCEGDPARATLVNGEAAGIVAEACRNAGAAMVYVSSNEVFDGEKGHPYIEDDAPNPINAYGRSKLEGEERVRVALGEHCIVRTSWLYGPGRQSFPEKILAAARERGSLRVVTDEVASPTWTVDLAHGIAGLVRVRATGVFHLTNEGSCSRKEWAEDVLRLADLKDVPVAPARQEEFGSPYRKPPFTVLANVHAARLGVSLRPWREALADHLRGVTVPEGAPL